MASKKLFPSPHEIDTIPGTEGWQRMYPYHYTFSTTYPERTEYEEGMFWFYDGLHYPEPVYPFDLIWDEAWYLALSQYNTRIFSVPPAYGIDHRIVNGYAYIAPVAVKDPREVEARAAQFRERAGYYYDNWEPLVAKWEQKLKDTIARLEQLEIPRLPEMEDRSVVTEGVGESKGYRLLKAYDDLINLGILCWQYHFEFLNLAYAAYVSFLDLCQRVFPDVPSQSVTQMISGIDVIMYQPDEELKNLARSAVELALEKVLSSSGSFAEVEAALLKSAAGRKWLAELERARYPWFHISTGTGWYHHDRSWNDNLDVPLASICMYVGKIKLGQSIERPLAEVRKQRDRVTAEYRALIGSAEDRAAFDQLLETARKVFSYVENHLFYVEHWFHSLFWNKVREVGAILKEYGFIGDIEEVWYLRRAEIKEALWDLVCAWATGIKPCGPLVWPKEIAWRKEVMRKFHEWRPPPALGRVPEVIQEPFTMVLWGVTNASFNSWAKLREAQAAGDVREIVGFAASPGMAEGPARVCRSVEEIRHLQDGEILVAPTTSPSWAPAFVKIKACVTDVGGVMCHAAIVCREYGMPAVVGTGGATAIVKTGMTLRVNGSTGEVTIAQ